RTHIPIAHRDGHERIMLPWRRGRKRPMRERSELGVARDPDVQLAFDIERVLTRTIEIRRSPYPQSVGAETRQPALDVQEGIGNRRQRIDLSVRVTYRWSGIQRLIRPPMPIIIICADQVGVVYVLQAAVMRPNGGIVIGSRSPQALHD